LKAELAIANNGAILYLPVLEGIKVDWQRRGAAGKMTFEVAMDDACKLAEGDAAALKIDGQDMFRGYVTRYSRTKEMKWSVTAMDQLWYLIKNKDTYNYQNKTLSQVVRMVADDYQLTCGELQDCGYVIKSRCEQDTSLMEIILNAMDEVLTNARQMYVLFDDCGKLTLKNIESMRLDLLADDETAEDYEYASSIEEGVYNKIKIVHEDAEAGKRNIYVAQDSANMAKWGVLQMTDKVQTRATAAPKANALLSLYNRPKRTFSLKNMLGDPRVRGGSMIGCVMDLGQEKVKQFLIVESVTHDFTNRQHLMSSTLRGGMFSA
jgi:hypothetical protein